MHDLIEACLSAKDYREVEIDARFDERCGDDTALRALGEQIAGFAEDRAAIGRDLPCAGMNKPFEPRLLRRGVELQRMRSAVHDDERLPMVGEGGDKIRVALLTDDPQGHPPQLLVQRRRIWRELAVSAYTEASLEIGRCKSRLGRGAKHDAAAIVAHELIESGNARAQNRQRDGLGFVQHD